MDFDKTLIEIRKYIASCEDDDGSFTFENKAENLLDDALTIIDQLLEASYKLTDVENANNRLKKEVEKLKIIVDWQSDEVLKLSFEKLRNNKEEPKMNANKIVVPANVANAIAHYVALADTKHEAFTDILRLGYEAERSEIILRHFEHDYDELMEALICGYQVAEETPEAKIAEFYAENRDKYLEAAPGEGDHYYSIRVGIRTTLNLLGITIEGVNGEWD